MPIDALSVLCAQLTCDLLAIAKFLLKVVTNNYAVVVFAIAVYVPKILQNV